MTAENRHIQVVVAYDFTTTAEQALLRAVEVACRAPQHALHVITTIDPREGVTAMPTKKVDWEYAEQVQNTLAERIKLAFAGRPSVSEVQFFAHARIGKKPAEEILTLCKEVGADLVFIGSHGSTGLERLMLGSVSERVVREAKCPVMVVRAKTYEDVDLMNVFKYEHERKPYTGPHKYSYAGRAEVTRPNDWPIS
ncbi:MAG: universal stress protein [Myxococcales bacterium]|nr:universal stress protein [Myxococcales bacterium]